jgi:hypothetical protein
MMGKRNVSALKQNERGHYREKGVPNYQVCLEQYLEEAPLDILAVKKSQDQ